MGLNWNQDNDTLGVTLTYGIVLLSHDTDNVICHTIDLTHDNLKKKIKKITIETQLKRF